MAQELQNGFELPYTPETAAEVHVEKVEAPRMPVEIEPSPVPYVAVAPAPLPAPAAKEPVLQEIEAILSDNIGDLYKRLPADKKQAFKVRGEMVATQINAMMKGGVMRIKKILNLIYEWLQLIPGVNKFFLEQEAKLKADKIQLIYAREHQPAV